MTKIYSRVRQTWLSEEPEAVEKLRKLSEGSKIPDFEPNPEWETYLFLKIEGLDKDSQLALLTNSVYDNPCIEFYPIRKVKYFREDGQPNIIALPRGFGADEPRREMILPGSKGYERYSQMLEGAKVQR